MSARWRQMQDPAETTPRPSGTTTQKVDNVVGFFGEDAEEMETDLRMKILARNDVVAKIKNKQCLNLRTEPMKEQMIGLKKEHVTKRIVKEQMTEHIRKEQMIELSMKEQMIEQLQEDKIPMKERLKEYMKRKAMELICATCHRRWDHVTITNTLGIMMQN